MRSLWQSWIGLPLLVLTIASPAIAEIVDIQLLHLNDIYEITPVEAGKRGGLARVATLRQQLLRQNPRTYTILAGDAFSPSALGTAEVQGKRLAGQQMVSVMNVVGFDYATFGNHEFDLSEEQFHQRLRESRFQWLSSNVMDAVGKPFKRVPLSQVLTVKGNQGAVVRVGLIGITLDSNRQSYVSFRDPIGSAREQVKALKGRADIIVAITHLSIEQDQQLAVAVPEIDLIIGGHEHENIQQWRGSDFTPIVKADANARSVYIHNLLYDTKTRHLQVNSRFQPITDAISEDPRTAKVVQQWVERAYQGFRAKGFAPEQAIATTQEALDGLESSVRNRSTNLTNLIAQAMLQEVSDADLAIFNGGSIRIDDQIPPGPITQYDVIRILPFGGKVLSVEIKGDLLQQVLDQGQTNRGNGGYLQTANVSRSPNSNHWLIKGQPLAMNRTYRVAINDFLITGRESGLGFLTLQNPSVKLIAEKRDIRFVVIDQFQAKQSSTCVQECKNFQSVK